MKVKWKLMDGMNFKKANYTWLLTAVFGIYRRTPAILAGFSLKTSQVVSESVRELLFWLLLSLSSSIKSDRTRVWFWCDIDVSFLTVVG